MLFNVSHKNNDLQTLVHELSKSKPDVNMVKRKTDTLGIPYNSDLIVLMSEVLVYLSKKTSSKNNQQKQSKENII